MMRVDHLFGLQYLNVNKKRHCAYRKLEERVATLNSAIKKPRYVFYLFTLTYFVYLASFNISSISLCFSDSVPYRIHQLL